MKPKLYMDLSNDGGQIGICYETDADSFAFHFGFCIKLGTGTALTERDFTRGSYERLGEIDEVQSYAVHYEHSQVELVLRLDLAEARQYAEWSVQILNRSDNPLEIESVDIGDGLLTRFGKQPSNAPWKALNIGLQSTDEHVGIETLKPDRQHYFDSVTMLHHTTTQRNILIGCCTFKRYFPHLLVQAREDDACSFIISNVMDHSLLLPGESVETEKAILMVGGRDHDGMFSLYMDRVCRDMKPSSRFRKPPVGWLSWYYYYGTVMEQDILDNVSGLQEYPDIRPEYIVIDAGWFLESGFGDWEANDKFPHGMKGLADQITAAGYKPGLWFSPFLADAGSMMVKAHPDWLLRKNGIPVAGMNPTGSDVLELHEKNKIKFVLDLTHPEVLAYLHTLFHRAVHEWGFKYIKLDFLIRSLFTDQGNHSSLTRDQVFFPGTTTAQAYRNAMRIIREAAGEDCYILGCAAPLFASIGNLIDGNRMTPDITRRNYTPDQIRPTGWELVKMCSRTMAARYFLHGRAGFNDPDVLVVRGHEPEGITDEYMPTLDEARVWAGVVALSGGLLFYNDKLATLEEERKPLLSQLFPVGPGAAVPVDFFHTDAPEIWKLPVQRGADSWTVLGLFNWGETTKNIEVDLRELGFHEEEDIHGIELWSQAYVTGRDRFTAHDVPPHAMRLISLHTKLDRPHVIGTEMHFTQGCAEFGHVVWEDRTLMLAWHSDYTRRGKISIYVPPAFMEDAIESNAKETRLSGHVLTIDPKEDDGRMLWVRFDQNNH
ncbi:alpha-galactosidase [Paenibacillus nasutitermitis]|uniref:Alpha galactosidase C-terminal domain-containing protein n=1 Tax=Paenibacillus nasutitermitis TaxID=1652958 RepID=A0A917DRN3_9BACL|nr:alpha-galactosidase [Paenibacillus nasutitermitis]GGD62194.1 hypothetical protein GCM10010911_20120 [Paenibacillus nasutitermitis]